MRGKQLALLLICCFAFGGIAWGVECGFWFCYEQTNPLPNSSYYVTSNVYVEGLVWSNIPMNPQPDCEFILKVMTFPGDVVMNEAGVTSDSNAEFEHNFTKPDGNWTAGAARIMPYCDGQDALERTSITFVSMP